MPLTRHRRIVAAALGSAALVATALTSGGTATAADQRRAIDPAATLSLWSPAEMTTKSYGGSVYTDFGVQLIAGDEPVEIRAHRPDWDSTIQAAWETAPGGPEAVPDTWMSSFAGLDDFVKIKVTDATTGKRITSVRMPGCFNSYTSQRIGPDAPAQSPYPASCPWNPYTVGSVMGLQAHYTTSLMGEYGGTELPLDKGEYDVTTTIAPRWVEFFGIPDTGAATTTTRLHVKKSRCCDRPRAATGTPQALQPAGTTAPARMDDPEPPPEALAPDLRSLPSWNIGLNRTGTQLRFGATVWNAGPAPMVVDGYRNQEDLDHMDAFQFLYDDEGNEVYHQAVGEMHWHAANHNHWHFEDFARYRLLTNDLSESVVSGKQSFCLAPTDAVDLTVDGANMKQEAADLGSSCGGYDALAVREALPAGWGDTYFQFRAGQSFDITDVPDGVYKISVEANPSHTLIEGDTTNNNSLRKIKLFHQGGERRVKVFQKGIIDEFVDGGFFRAPAGV